MSRSSSPSTSHASKPRINSSSPTEKKATSVLRPRQQALDAIAANKGNSKEVVPESVAANESASAEDKRPSSPDAARILEEEAKETVQTSYPASYNSRSQHDQSSRSWDANKQYGDNRHPNNGPRNNWGYDRYSDNRGLPRNTPTGPREGRRGSSQRSRRRRDHPKHYYPPETLPYDSPSKTGSKRRSPPSYDNERPSKRSSRRDRSSSYGRKRRSRSRDRFRDSSRSPTRSHGYSARDERSSSSRERRRQRSRERSQSRDRRHSPQHLHHPTPYDEQTPYGPHLPDPPTLPEDSVPTPTRNDSQLSLLYPTSPIPAPSEQALADLSILQRQLQEERTKCQTMEQELAHYKTQLDTVITRHIQVMENHPTPAMFESDSGTMPKVNFDGPRPEHTIPQEHGTAMADGRGEEELSEIAGLRQQLVDIRAELQETKDALDARTLELRGSNAFLTRADSSSNSDCIRLVEALNHEIEQTCASIADSVTIEKDQPPDPTALTDAEAFVLESYGQPLLSYMCRNRESHDHGLTQYVLTHSLVKRCYSLLSLWSWNPQDSKSIEAVYNGLKAASIPQPVAGRWRSLTHAQTKRHDSALLETLSEDLTDCVLNVLTVNGWCSSSNSLDTVTRMCKDRMSSVINALFASDKMLMEDITSVDVEVFVVSDGDPYDENVEDSEGNPQSQEERVAFSMALGLRARNIETDETRVLLKSKAFLQSTIDDFSN